MNDKDRADMQEYLEMTTRLLGLLKMEGFVPETTTPDEMTEILKSTAARLEDQPIPISYLLVFSDAFYKTHNYLPFNSPNITLDVVVGDAIGRYQYAKKVMAERTRHF